MATRLGRTRVHAAGPPDADAVLLIGGGGAPSPVWADVASALAPDHQVLALDVPGDTGRSEAPIRRPRTTGDVANWLEDVRAGLDLDRLVVVGHSYGAWLALTHALAHPARVAHLVLLRPRRPSAQQLAGLGVPVSVLLAEHSRAHDTTAGAQRAREHLPTATITTLAGVSHHTIPTEHPHQLAQAIRDATTRR